MATSTTKDYVAWKDFEPNFAMGKTILTQYFKDVL